MLALGLLHHVLQVFRLHTHTGLQAKPETWTHNDRGSTPGGRSRVAPIPQTHVQSIHTVLNRATNRTRPSGNRTHDLSRPQRPRATRPHSQDVGSPVWALHAAAYMKHLCSGLAWLRTHSACGMGLHPAAWQAVWTSASSLSWCVPIRAC